MNIYPRKAQHQPFIAYDRIILVSSIDDSDSKDVDFLDVLACLCFVQHVESATLNLRSV